MDVLALLAALVAIGFAASARMRSSQDIDQLRHQIVELTKALTGLRSDFDALKRGGAAPLLEEAAPARPAPAAEAAKPAAPAMPPPSPPPPQTAAAEASVPRSGPYPPASPRREPPKPIDFEKQFGAKLPVWIGGISIALAIIFGVKYSIDEGYLNPTVRCLLGGLAGLAALGAAQWIRARPAIANGERIAQALSGAGIAGLYGVLYSATSLYELIPSAAGFIAMAIVTATAVVLSLRHGAPIAVLGMVGGFLTPLLVRSDEPNAAVLFTYLIALTAGLFLVIRHRNWWWLAWPTIGAAFLWLGVWIAFFSAPGDSIWLSLFLLASVAVVVGATTRRALLPYEAGDEHASRAPGVFGIVVLAIAVLFMAAITARSHFETSEWVLYGLLAFASIVLAVYDERYRIAPWLSFAVSVVLLVVWETPETEMFVATLLAFATLYTASGYLMLWRGRDARSWAALSALSALTFYLLAYARLKEFTDAWTVIAQAAHTTAFPVWGAIAMVLGALATLATGRIMEAFTGAERTKQEMLAIFAVAATSFVAIGLGIELEREFFTVALAAQVLTLGWIDSRVEIKALRYIAAGVAGVFALLLAPQVMLLVELTGYALAETRFDVIDRLPVVAHPIFQLGVPAAMFAGAGYFFRQRGDDAIVRAFEGAAIALAAVMGYYLIRYAFYSGDDVLFSPGTFFERGVITNVLFLYALALLWVGQRFSRIAVQTGGAIIGAIAIFRIAFFDIIVSNPVMVDHDVGSWPVINYLLLPFGLPVVWLWLAARFSPKIGQRETMPVVGTAALVFAFMLLSLNVRQIYQGAVLHSSYTSDAEIYTYSFVWLIFGIGLLFMGTLRKNKLLRYASLAVMVLTVGKVFLYDASELTGLLRVFSFFGLGLSLLGLSWFYTRFVFVRDEKGAAG